jgi:hypothetical protein
MSEMHPFGPQDRWLWFIDYFINVLFSLSRVKTSTPNGPIVPAPDNDEIRVRNCGMMTEKQK